MVACFYNPGPLVTKGPFPERTRRPVDQYEAHEVSPSSVYPCEAARRGREAELRDGVVSSTASCGSERINARALAPSVPRAEVEGGDRAKKAGG